jgi:hypothetical protein
MRPVAVPHTRKRPLASAAPAIVLLALAGGCSAADSGPTGIIPGAIGLGKVCHELSRSGQPVTLTLKFGDPAVTEISAVTGACAPPVGMPCTQIPVGKVPIKLYEGTKLLSSRFVILSAPQAGAAPNEYVFQPAVDNSTLQVVVIGGRIATGTCQGLDFPPPDGGTSDGGDGSVMEAGVTEGGVEAGPTADAAVDAGAPDVSATADAAADAAGPDAAEDAPAAADVASDTAAD